MQAVISLPRQPRALLEESEAKPSPAPPKLSTSPQPRRADKYSRARPLQNTHTHKGRNSHCCIKARQAAFLKRALSGRQRQGSVSEEQHRDRERSVFLRPCRPVCSPLVCVQTLWPVNEPEKLVSLSIGAQFPSDLIFLLLFLLLGLWRPLHGEDAGDLRRGLWILLAATGRALGVHRSLWQCRDHPDPGGHLPVHSGRQRFLPRGRHCHHIQQPDRGPGRKAGCRRHSDEHLHPQVPAARGRGPHLGHLCPGGERSADCQGEKTPSQAQRPRPPHLPHRDQDLSCSHPPSRPETDTHTHTDTDKIDTHQHALCPDLQEPDPLLCK